MATPLAEKPPLYRSLPNESLTSISTPPRVGKLNRSTPVSTKRTNSTARIGSLRKPRKRADSLSESESDFSGNDLENTQEQQKTIKNNKNENKLQQENISTENNNCEQNNVQLQQNLKQINGVKTSLNDKNKLSSPISEAKQEDSFTKGFRHINSLLSIKENSSVKLNANNCVPRRHTEVISPLDKQNLSVDTQSTNDLFKRRNTTDASCNEFFRNETKLVVLEYLSSLTTDKITARNIASRSNSRVSRSSSRGSNANSNLSDLYVSPTSSSEINKNEKHLEAFSKIENEEKSKTLPRERRKKTSKEEGVHKEKANTITIGENERKLLMEQLAAFNAEQAKLSGKTHLMRSNSDVTEENFANVRKKLSQMKVPVKQWISSNMKKEIVTFDAKTQLKEQYCKFKKPPKPLSLSIPQHNIKEFQDIAVDFTPQAYAVNRLEEMAIEIMKDFPDILSQHVDDLLRPLENNDMISYESFVKIAKDVYNKNLFNVSGSVWTRVALVLHTVKETIFSGNLDDDQLELLVDYSTKFVTENADEIEKTMDLDETLFNATGLAYRGMSSDEELTPDAESTNFPQQSNENLSYTQKIVQVVNEWTPFGIAALAVGMGLAYSYIKP
ncbi:myosin-G heavy chain isoform X2 [Hydra vulgaris]|uniref:myosin-G heavy chain isoform X2 n=1 Tax=Hydra vulgaris TaxID=6087 RepID=UPI001F5F44EB|nr:myosin-G heavy chain isoform X2 [Hydra vulgaris]